MKNISIQCEKEINAINSLVTKTLKELANAKKQVLATERMLEVLNGETTEKIKRAYILGYKAGLSASENTDNSGGYTKEENNKLILKKD